MLDISSLHLTMFPHFFMFPLKSVCDSGLFFTFYIEIGNLYKVGSVKHPNIKRDF